MGTKLDFGCANYGSNHWETYYEYFKNGWLKKVRMPETGTAVVRADYEYDAAGKPTKESYGNGTFAQYQYDPTNLQLTLLKHYNPQNTLLRGVEYQRDDVGSPTQLKTVWNGGNSINDCDYDDINRLTSASSPSSATFDYDWVGNRKGEDWAVNNVDELTSDPFGHSYSYDLCGNMTARDSLTFDYDNYNMLSYIHWLNSDVTGFVNDAAGNRVQMITSGEATYRFIYDTTAGIPAVLAEIGGGATKLYVRTPDGRLVAQVHISSGNPVLDHYYHFDALGSTIALTSGSGTVTDTYTYDVWGNPTHASGSAVQPYLFVGQLGYYSHYQDNLLNPFSTSSEKYPLLQLGVRYYDAQIGCFVQRDPLPEDGASTYAYASGRPTLYADPLGARAVNPGDRRFPRPPFYPIPSNLLCVDRARISAMRIYHRHFRPGTPGGASGPPNAFLHCVWACLTRKTCGAACYNAGVIDHETWAPWARGHWSNNESPMDLANDEVGRKCSLNTSWSCEQCCVYSYHHDRLYWGPKPWR